MSNDILWQAKLAARIHDPAEKALVLLRDPEGHEGGTVHSLKRLLGMDRLPNHIDPDSDESLSTVIFKNGLPQEIYHYVQRADWWAAAADRPQWPMQEITVPTKRGEEKTLKIASWAQVRWANEPVLAHPLTGDKFDLGKAGGLSDTEISDIKQRSFDHFSELLVKLGAGSDEAQDLRKTLLIYWRFGPDLSATNADTENNEKLGKLWEVLPADTRIPDHSIWDHLDLTSAFAGAFAADPNGEAALLTLSIGPVQPFIAAARTTSDLWAGSHLLSRLAWEAMRPVCEELGPDAILFPRLRGIPQVDLWLRDHMELPDSLFKDCEWNKGSTDANPLFSAALPNRFVAVVPANKAQEITAAVEKAVRNWMQDLGDKVVVRLLTEAGYEEVENVSTPFEQMKQQLAGFPEVHWAAVPFSLIHCRDKRKQSELDVSQLSEAMRPFFTGDGEPGFLSSPAWQVLQKDIDWDDNTTFWQPNPGVLYPAIFDLAERVLAAAKVTRGFEQTRQEGWRCSLTGESEWLTTDRAQLSWNQTYRQKQGTLWTRIAEAKPAWARKGEHLGGLSAIKRLWPTLFKEEVGKALTAADDGSMRQIDRFVVSTHTMALAGNLGMLDEKLASPELAEKISAFIKPIDQVPALPRRQAYLRGSLAARIPAALDRLSESTEPADGQQLARLESQLKEALGFRPETYYALIMMDGDRMGAILSGDETTKTAIAYRESFHPRVRDGFDKHAAQHEKIARYGKQPRAISPNRHLAISGALNDFSQTVVRHVVEQEHLGRLIYAGGDDVLVMLPVADMLSAMQRLRYAYSGSDPEHEGGRATNGLTLHNGFAVLKDRKLMRMMGKNATASCGAVIAHHQAPLSAVLRELRAAESRAKNEGGRDAFSITVIKRSGGALTLTENWGKPVTLLRDLRKFLTDDDVSRRAVYHTLEWLSDKDLPVPSGEGEMLRTLLEYQLKRQSSGKARDQVADLAQRLTALTMGWAEGKRIAKLRNFLSVAEFLARETRTGDQT